jgi:hypothetical protein
VEAAEVLQQALVVLEDQVLAAMAAHLHQEVTL